MDWETRGRHIVEGAVSKELGSFTCHEFQNVMCRGFWMKHGRKKPYGRWAADHDYIDWVEAP